VQRPTFLLVLRCAVLHCAAPLCAVQLPHLLLEVAHDVRPDVYVRSEEPLYHPGLVGLLAVDLEGLVLLPPQQQLAHQLQRQVHGNDLVGTTTARCSGELLHQERLDRQHGLTAEYAVPPACRKPNTHAHKNSR